MALRLILLTVFLAAFTPIAAEAQSATQTVTLRIGFMSRIEPAAAQVRSATTQQVVVAQPLKVWANAGYQLMVSAVGITRGRVFARTAGGDYRELTPGTAVAIAWGERAAGVPAEAMFRVEGGESEPELKVVYEIRQTDG